MGKVNVFFLAPAAKRTGHLQIVFGAICIVFNLATLVLGLAIEKMLVQSQWMSPGVWAGVFYIVTGILMRVAAAGRKSCAIVVALTLNVMSLILNIANVIIIGFALMSIDRHQLYGYGTDERWQFPVFVTLFAVSFISAFVETLLIFWGIFLCSLSIYWARLDEHGGAFTDEDFHMNPNPALATFAVRFNGVTQIATGLTSATVNIAAICVFVYGVGYANERMSQTSGMAIFAAPFYVIVGVTAISAAATGNNGQIIIFLCLSIFCCVISFLEGGGACFAISRYDVDMKLPPEENCTTKMDRWGYNHTECDWYYPPNEDMYVSTLISLNGIILLFAIYHFTMSVWGVILASTALHKDGSCIRCCANCCVGSSSSSCDKCCPHGGVIHRYQPIQFVVSHQGMTTTEDGKRALVVLLPVEGNLRVTMENPEGGQAIVSLEEGQSVLGEVLG